MWIEGYPEIYADLEENLNNFYGQKPILALLGDQNKKVNFHVSNRDSSCSSIFDFSDDVKNKKLWATNNLKMLKTISLDMKKLDNILLENKIDPKDYNHWVIDLQGAELQALKGAENSIVHCKSIYVEISQKQYYENGSTNWIDLKNYLNSLNFKLINPPSEDHCEVLFERF